MRCLPTALLLLSGLIGCDAATASVPATVAIPGPAAEVMVRQRMDLPPAASLSAVSAVAIAAPASTLPGAVSTWLGGPSKPSGLRVVASFALPMSAVEPDYWSEWQPTPLPSEVAGFREGPVEVAHITGFYRCSVRSSSPGSQSGYSVSGCTRPPANFDAFEVAVYEPTSGAMTVVMKQYY